MPADECDFKVVRLRRKKKMADERCDDEVIESRIDKYKIEVYFYIVDGIQSEMNERRDGVEAISKMFGFLVPK